MYIEDKKAMFLLNLLNNVAEHKKCSPHHHEAVCLGAILSRFDAFDFGSLIVDIEKQLLAPHNRSHAPFE